MKIERFLDGVIVADGGTVSCRAVLDDGSTVELGLDARIPRTKAQKQVFIGASYPTSPGARTLARGSQEERDVIAAIQDYLDRHCGFLRREALMTADPTTLTGQDRSDHMAVTLLRDILDR